MISKLVQTEVKKVTEPGISTGKMKKRKFVQAAVAEEIEVVRLPVTMVIGALLRSRAPGAAVGDSKCAIERYCEAAVL